MITESTPNNLVPYMKVFKKKHEDLILEAIRERLPTIHAGSMWFVERNLVLELLEAKLLKLKDASSTRLKNGIKYYDPNVGSPSIKRCIEIISVLGAPNA